MGVCAHIYCDKHPTYNKPGSTKAIFCNEHKQDGMINVKDKRCSHDNCFTIPTFGLPGYTASRCKQHIEAGMIVKPKSKCFHSKCKENALYGICTPIACELHKEIFHLNLVERECLSCKFLYILNKKGLCNICDPDEFNKSRLAKQNQIKNFLDINNIEYVSCDRMVEMGECFTYRPDFLFDCGTHFVVLEVDENQHKQIDRYCEKIRMINIYQSLGMRTKFIRYNPDEYKFNKSKRNPAFTTRGSKLKDALKYAFEDEPVSNLSIKYLFYDNNENSEFKSIVIEEQGL